MLQEATKALNSAFNNSFIKKVSQYLHDCVREEVKSSTFRNLKGDKDNKWIFLKEKETLLTDGLEYLKLDGANPNLTELMIQSENNSRDKYLIYGYMFLVGRNAEKPAAPKSDTHRRDRKRDGGALLRGIPEPGSDSAGTVSVISLICQSGCRMKG